MAVMYPRYPYDAAITKPDYWTWSPHHYAPPLDKEATIKHRPILPAGQYIRLRLLGCGPNCQGPHKLIFTNMSPDSKQVSPFEAPFNNKNVEYGSPWESMFKVAMHDLDNVFWSFTIDCEHRKESIDPEFHVGSGPARTKSE